MDLGDALEDSSHNLRFGTFCACRNSKLESVHERQLGDLICFGEVEPC